MKYLEMCAALLLLLFYLTTQSYFSPICLNIAVLPPSLVCISLYYHISLYRTSFVYRPNASTVRFITCVPGSGVVIIIIIIMQW